MERRKALENPGASAGVGGQALRRLGVHRRGRLGGAVCWVVRRLSGMFPDGDPSVFFMEARKQ